jgi:hypothetical protein
MTSSRQFDIAVDLKFEVDAATVTTAFAGHRSPFFNCPCASASRTALSISR